MMGASDVVYVERKGPSTDPWGCWFSSAWITLDFVFISSHLTSLELAFFFCENMSGACL